MLGLGIIVLVHGIVLLTPMAGRFGRGSGRLMVLWAVIMLLNKGCPHWYPAGVCPDRAWAAARWRRRWDGDAGMVAIAVLLLASASS